MQESRFLCGVIITAAAAAADRKTFLKHLTIKPREFILRDKKYVTFRHFLSLSSPRIGHSTLNNGRYVKFGYKYTKLKAPSDWMPLHRSPLNNQTEGERTDADGRTSSSITADGRIGSQHGFTWSFNLVEKDLCHLGKFLMVYIWYSIQRSAKVFVRGCEKFVTALAYLFCLVPA